MTKDTSSPSHFDYLIIGQGLAGSLLAWSLLKQHKDVCLVSDGQHSASRVAAGLINPVTGQRFVLTDLTPAMISKAVSFYQDIETSLGIQVYHPRSMARIFNSEKEQANCKKRLNQARYHPFFGSTTLPESLNSDFSGVVQNNTAWLDTNLLLDSLDVYFQQHAHVIHAEFKAEDLTHHADYIHWQGINAKQLICCQGYQMLENDLFSWLPLQPAHGEIITCDTQQALESDIINKSKWLLPTSAYRCRIGATYEPDISQPTVQEKSKQELITFANTLFTEKKVFNCVDHQAGIRPATKDKQPFIGFHPLHSNIAIFNGFGSRGSLMIPYYSDAFSTTLTQGKTIPCEVNINRYQSTYT